MTRLTTNSEISAAVIHNFNAQLQRYRYGVRVFLMPLLGNGWQVWLGLVARKETERL